MISVTSDSQNFILSPVAYFGKPHKAYIRNVIFDTRNVLNVWDLYMLNMRGYNSIINFCYANHDGEFKDKIAEIKDFFTNTLKNGILTSTELRYRERDNLDGLKRKDSVFHMKLSRDARLETESLNLTGNNMGLDMALQYLTSQNMKSERPHENVIIAKNIQEFMKSLTGDDNLAEIIATYRWFNNDLNPMILRFNKSPNEEIRRNVVLYGSSSNLVIDGFTAREGSFIAARFEPIKA